MKQRKHIRLRDFDYASGNAYFITICTHGFAAMFGEVRNGVMGLSAIGNQAWLLLGEIPNIRTGVQLDEAIIMPNHLHFILELPGRNSASEWQPNEFMHTAANSVSIIVNHYKGALKKWCNANGFRHFEWQARFYDHIIRDNDSYWKIKEYIQNNPANWERDKLFARPA